MVSISIVKEAINASIMFTFLKPDKKLVRKKKVLLFGSTDLQPHV